MNIIILLKYLCSFLLATVIQGFSKKLGLYILIPGFNFLNILYSLFINLGITYMATFLFWEIFRIFENDKIIKYSQMFSNLINLHKNSIIPPGFMLHWRIFSLRMFYALLITSLAEGGFLLTQYISPYLADNFITIFTHAYFVVDLFLLYFYDWIIEPPMHDVPNVADEFELAPPLPYEEIKTAAEEKMKQENAILEQKKTLYRGLFSIHTAIWISGIAICEAIYTYYFEK